MCVPDLSVGRAIFEDRYGLASLPGGRHPGLGTANRIIPIGGSYIELIAVVDSEEASHNAFGNWVLSHASSVPRVDAICLRTADITEVAHRLGLEPLEMSRLRPDGFRISWILAGLEAMIDRGLPFFVEWKTPDEELPWARPIQHPSGEARLDQVVFHRSDEEILSWTYGAQQVQVEPGEGAISAKIVTTGGVIEV